ncbi:hypothetical protein C8J35_103530 [Rhizobium sp. PP-F2F-G38]|nr:hypothetical protein C8J35_103530 [Rhizobium sp. PP-F2F-G38]
MSVGTASKLDTEKFRKVHALMKGGATEGERSAARSRAEAMAKSAGLSLQQAASSLDTPAQAKPANFFDGFEDWMEKETPGYKAERARKRSEQEDRRAAGRADARARYGSEPAVFDASEREALLSEAVSPFATWDTYTDNWGRCLRFSIALDGARFEFWSDLPNLSARVRSAVETAYPMPSNLSGVLEEWRYWRALEADREFFVDEWQHNTEVNARIAIIEQALNHRPVKTWDDMQARLDWWEHELQRDFSPSAEEERRLKKRIEEDFNILRAMAENPAMTADPMTFNTPPHGGARAQTGSAQFEHRTNADKADAVRSMLRSHPDLSNREIGRRAGVSPQTVGTWRSKMGSGAHG